MQPRRLEECKVFSRNMRKTDLNLFIFTRGIISQNYVKDFRFITFEIYLMDSKRIHEDITHLLNKVVEQYSRILQFDNSVPIMEVDLALKDVRDLYESLLDLRTISEIQRRKSQDSEGTTSKTINNSVVESIVIETPKEEISVASIPDEVESVKAPEVVLESVVEAEKTVIEINNPVEIKMEESPIAWQKTFDASDSKDAVVVAPAETIPAAVVSPKVDLLQERQKDFVPTVRKIEFKPEPILVDPKKESLFDKAASLYDKIAKPAEKTVASQASQNPISNIKSSIGINEKFAYLKDLFKNNMAEYNDALDKLNNFENYGEAEDFFQELKSKYSWDPESKSFQGLAELLNRRYLHNA
jgi:hypothetical protein